MAGNYGPEVKAAMAERKTTGRNPAPPMRKAAPKSFPPKGSKPPAAGATSPQGATASQQGVMPGVVNATMPTQAGAPHIDPQHVAAAAGIAHAILNRGGV